jgi:hypothetical protein
MNNSQIIAFLLTRPANEINYGYVFIPQEIVDEAASNNKRVKLTNMTRGVTEVSFGNEDFVITRISRSEHEDVLTDDSSSYDDDRLSSSDESIELDYSV